MVGKPPRGPKRSRKTTNSAASEQKRELTARRKLRKRLLREPCDWSIADLTAVITERYAPTVIPPCRVCGGELSIGSIGGGEPTRWRCSGQEEDAKGDLHWIAGRTPADQHYSDSLFIDRRQGGDEAVMELLSRFRSLTVR